MSRFEDTGPAALRAVPVTPEFVARIEDVDLSRPLPEDAWQALLARFHRYKILVFPGQRLTPRQLADFGARFGPLEVHHLPEHLLQGLPEVRVISNARREGQDVGAARAGQYWHSDLSYLSQPALATLLYCVECPPVGGDTLFADMVAAWEALPPQTQRRIRGARAVRDRAYRYNEHYPNRPPLSEAQKAAMPPVEHPMVRRHPDTGQLALYIAAGSCSHVVGMDVEEGRRLLQELEAFATQDRFVHAHHWTPGDLVVWDNRVTLHCATGCDPRYTRTMQRVQAVGEQPLAA